MQLDEFVVESKKYPCKICAGHPKSAELEDGLNKGYPLNTMARWSRAEGCYVSVATLTRHRDHLAREK